MINTIIIKEFNNLIKNNVFFLYIVIVIVISIFSGIVASSNYKTINNKHLQQVESYDKHLKSACNGSLERVAFMKHLAIQDVNPYVFLVGSEATRYPNHTFIHIPNVFFSRNPVAYFPRLPVENEISFLGFIKYDLLFIIEALLSFIFILVTYNSISKEKEEGTISLIFSNGISKMHVLIGKIITYLLLVIFSIVVVIIFQQLIILYLGKIPLQKHLFISIIPFILSSFLYLSFWVLLSVLISIKAKTSNLALTFLLIIWMLFVFIIPTTGALIIKFSGRLTTFEEINSMYEKTEEDMWNKAGQENAGWRGGNLRANSKDDHIMEKNFAPIYLESLDKLNKYQYSVINNQINQLNNIYVFSSISPSFLYRRITESFYNTGPDVHKKFIQNVQAYRRELISSIIRLDRKDENSFHLCFLPNYMSKKPIDPGQLPIFRDPKLKLRDIIIKNRWVIALLLFELIVVFVLSYVYFIKYDPR